MHDIFGHRFGHVLYLLFKDQHHSSLLSFLFAFTERRFPFVLLSPYHETYDVRAKTNANLEFQTIMERYRAINGTSGLPFNSRDGSLFSK